jgi:nucleoside-diphosphate-sugar epimerase
MDNLVVGNTSQIAKFFSDDYLKISSRNLTLSDDAKYNNVYITFAEQRTFDTSLSESDFIDVNVNYTLKVAEHYSKLANKVFLYGTAELWNNYNGPISLSDNFDYKYSPYTKSKHILWDELKNLQSKGKFNNVFIIHPFNFNSLHRKHGFLFYKIFDSILNNTQISVGNLNLQRDIIHPKFLVEQSTTANSDMIVGSGVITNVREFIINLYESFGKDYDKLVIENDTAKSIHANNVFWSDTNTKYTTLLEDTITELKNKIYERN